MKITSQYLSTTLTVSSLVVAGLFLSSETATPMHQKGAIRQTPSLQKAFIATLDEVGQAIEKLKTSIATIQDSQTKQALNDVRDVFEKINNKLNRKRRFVIHRKPHHKKEQGKKGHHPHKQAHEKSVEGQMPMRSATIAPASPVSAATAASKASAAPVTAETESDGDDEGTQDEEETEETVEEVEDTPDDVTSQTGNGAIAAA